MCPMLCVTNDRSHEFERWEANIFTTGQGIRLQRLELKNCEKFEFNRSLSYGLWYDIQIIAHLKNSDSEPQRYLRKGFYLSYGKQVKMIELTDEKYRDYGIEWKCDHCKKSNFGSVAICEHCHTNKLQTILSAFSMIPILGIPFSITNAILRCGKAAQSNKPSDQIDAAVTIAFAVVDVVTAPFIIGSLAKIPTKVAAQTGIELTAKTVLGEAGKPLLKEFGKELGGNGIIRAVTLAKAAVQTTITNINDKK